MYLNGYTATIEGGEERSVGYVHMRHGQSYGIELRNGKAVRCNAAISIDGKSIGTWRLDPGAVATIQRPANEDGQLTFYKTNSTEGRITDHGIDIQEEGLIQVTFTPEKQVKANVVLEKSQPNVSYDLLRKSREVVSGHTGLTEETGQVFGTASSMQVDMTKAVTINLRLVTQAVRPTPIFHPVSSMAVYPVESPMPRPVRAL